MHTRIYHYQISFVVVAWRHKYEAHSDNKIH